jgi:hypothetical protein
MWPEIERGLKMIAFILCALLLIFIALYPGKTEPLHMQDEPFMLAPYAEKIRELNELTSDLEMIEQMRTDLALLNADNVQAVTLQWQDSTGIDREYTILLDGQNTAHACMSEIMEREAFDLREEIAYKTRLLKCGRDEQW